MDIVKIPAQFPGALDQICRDGILADAKREKRPCPRSADEHVCGGAQMNFVRVEIDIADLERPRKISCQIHGFLVRGAALEQLCLDDENRINRAARDRVDLPAYRPVDSHPAAF